MPASPADPGKPMVPRGLYFVAAGMAALLNGWAFAVVLGAGVPGVLFGALYGLPVVVAWHRPMVAWWLMLGLLLLATALSIADWRPWLLSESVTQAPVMFTLALVSARRVTAVTFLTTLAAGVLSVLLVRPESPHVVQAMVSWSLVLLAVTMIGHSYRMRRLSTLRVAEEYGKRRLLEERARIARELHDLVAHHMSVIAVQASTAPYRIKGGASEEMLREFRDINAAASTSLTELRQLLGVLRGDRDDPLTAPQPSLDGLAELVESARRAGTPVHLELPEHTPEVGAAMSLTVYRIVQEALSNVIKHANGAATAVTIALDGRNLVVEVVNEAGVVESMPGSGYGLVGMRERVALAGGELFAGTLADGRYAVRAVLPQGEK
ncbi:histidine kinase [Nonomuraea sp. NPDC026600]|uniref:sensor histidine kinase n=1 Tax=Nonomuraea sp. NPDC026600 TaxID=3155363 RepID=UPI0033C0D513